jgi:Ca2+-binding EF-hand superfamily protein
MKGSYVGRVGYSPGKSEERGERSSNIYDVRFKRKDLREFNPINYRSASLTEQDVLDLKEVFDFYDSTGMGVLLPNDLKLLLAENGFQPNKRTVYEIIAEFDVEETGGISFREFMNAMDTRPYLNERKKDIMQVFKKYDRENKGFIHLEDLREVNRQLKENLDDDIIRSMLEKADSNRDGKITFDDFYSVMIRNIY